MSGRVTIEDIRAARERIRETVLRTPLVPFAGSQAERPLWLKLESLQPTAAFKLRGATNKIKLNLEQARERGVVAHSSGNHGRAVAYVARELGLKAVIVVPDAAPPGKIAAMRALGAEVVIVPPDERDTRAFELAAEHGYVPVPPYDDVDIVAGQGTAGLELVEDLPAVDVLLCPVSGGGLISGVATAVKALRPEVRVIGVEPELAADAQESLRSGRRVVWPSSATYRTAADGLRTTSVGHVGWEHIKAHVDDIVTVSEDEIRDAVYRLAVDARLVAEPSGAVTLAAYLNRGSELPSTGTFAALLSGGSVDLTYFVDALSSGVARAQSRAGDVEQS
jgi:threonine dehydratase